MDYSYSIDYDEFGWHTGNDYNLLKVVPIAFMLWVLFVIAHKHISYRKVAIIVF